MRGSHTFYELAATLIPILLLGGIVADRLRPDSREKLSERHAWIPVALTGLTGLAITAEVAAISAAEVGGTGFITVVVVLALLVGLLAVAAAIVGPWLARLPTRPRLVSLIGGGAIAISVFVGSFGTLKQTVEAAETNFGTTTDVLNLSEAGVRHYINATVAYDSAWARAQADERFTATECDLLEALDRRLQFELDVLVPGVDRTGPELQTRLCRASQRAGQGADLPDLTP